MRAFIATAIATALLGGCAGAPVQRKPAAACLELPPGMDAPHMLATILADACSSADTDDVLVEHALILLRGCHGPSDACIRFTCLRLGNDDNREPDGASR